MSGQATRGPNRQPHDFLAGSGEMGKLVREKNWSQTPLGPIESWPENLRTTVSLCLASNFPITIAWGPERTQIYNDGYWPVCADKHPHSMGQDFKECWYSAWPVIGKAFERASEGETCFLVNQRMFLDRLGYLEETFFTFSFSPIRDESGHVTGILNPMTELTQQSLAERRLHVLRNIAIRSANADSIETALAVVAESLEASELDVPFALFYRVDADGSRARLVKRVGLEAESSPALQTVDLNDGAAAWPFVEARRHGESLVVGDLHRHVGPFRCRPYEEPPKSAVVQPILMPGLEKPFGFLVTGVSSRRPLDEPYRNFHNMLGEAVANALAKARAYEEERRRAEALAKLDRAKTAFFSNVSHEFRTPLTLMLGPLEELLASAELSPASKYQMEVVNRNGLRLLRLVNNLLDFSRIEAGRVQARYERTDLGPFTADLASCFRSAMECAGLRLNLDCPSLSEPVYVDRDMWEKIVLNLISNAFKFTFEGEITVMMRRRDEAAELIVRDTGVGIPAEAMTKLFERFYRVENMRSRTHEGSGIGLALVRELVELHGGSVRAESRPGHGSSFTVTLPFGSGHLPADKIGSDRSLASRALGAGPFVEEAFRWLPEESALEEERLQHDDLVTVPGRPSAGEAKASRPRIVLADDNADMRRYAARLLAERYNVEVVPDGEAALAAAKRQTPDLILSDVMMPRLDGFGLLRELRNDQELKTMPVILLSARAGEESRIEGLERGADDYLVKPFSARELMARVQAHLDMARIRRESEARTKADLQAMTRLYEVGNRCVQAGHDFAACLDEMVATAIAITSADRGNLQLLDAATGRLTIAAHRGFDEPCLTFFDVVREGESAACGAAMRSLKRVIVEDVTESPVFAGQPTLNLLLDAGVRAVQSTPLVSSQGTVLGMISTHFSRPHRPSERDLRLMDLLARQAADYLERKANDQALHEAQQRLQQWNAELEQAVNIKTAELVQSQDRLRALATELNLAEQRERKRVAAELHDHLQQILVLGRLHVGQGKRAAAALPACAEALKNVDDVLAEALSYTRTLVAELSPPVLRDHGLPAGLKWLGEYMKKHNMAVTVTVPDDHAVPLPEDQAVLLFQSVRELLMNAWKHARTGQARIALQRRDGRLQIQVRDEGAGFDLAAAAAADSSSGGLSSKFGLFSIGERMRALGGSFEIQSALGKGTIATLTLPLVSLRETSATSEKSETNRNYERSMALSPIAPVVPFPLVPPTTRIRVLLADDHAMVRQGLRAVLEGHADIELVGEAADGEEAVMLADALRPSLILMDINMPRKNGIETTAVIKAKHPETKIIGLSVNVGAENQNAMLKAGACALLSKEAAVLQLYGAIQEAVKEGVR